MQISEIQSPLNFISGCASGCSPRLYD